MNKVIGSYAKRARAAVTVIGLVIALVAPTAIAVPLASALAGSGTSSSPFLVSSCSEFQDIPNDNAAYYLLTQDIDCSADGNAIMNPAAFTGTFNGGDYTITVAIDSSDPFVGLFSQLDSATVSNVTIAGSVQSNNSSGVDVGGLTGQMTNSTIDHVTINATVTMLYNSSGYTGGLAGYMLGSTISHVAVTNDVLSYDTTAGGLFGIVGCGISISDSYSSGNVSSNGDYAGGITAADGCQGPTTAYSRVHSSGTIVADGSQAGGLIGAANWAIITDSYATGYVEGINEVGGLVGIASSNTSISRSYANATVNAYNTYAGGLVGSMQYGSIIDQSFATGDVSAGSYGAGGLVGYYDGVTGSPAAILNSYARGPVTGDQAGGLIGSYDTGNVVTSYATGSVDVTHTDHGGLVGIDIGEPTDSLFWDTQTSGAASSPVGAGKTTAQMKTAATYTSAATPGIGTIWDFANNPNNDVGTSDIWNIQPNVNDGYPCLMWVSGCAPVITPGPSADNDGISTAIENAAPNNGDANNDGQLDSSQANVASFVDPVTNNYASLTISSGCTITNVNAESTASYTRQDGGFSYPFGMLDFSINCGSNGYQAAITHYYYGVSSGSYVVRKYAPASHAYTTIPGASYNAVTVGGRGAIKVQYSITDGSSFDDDGVTDGRIDDPAGLGLVTVGAPNTGAPTTPPVLPAITLWVGALLGILLVRRLNKSVYAKKSEA